ncbi:MAG: urea carboxylase [Verrucomicrobiaceae bacterium]|nr:urea carboxylase [Verrucomicrobiaceae bacterium]
MKLLIANRGVIACRIIRTAKKMGVKTVAVYSEADAGAPHVMQADEAVCLGPAPARESYLAVDKIMTAIRGTGATAVHPGYGFLSENADFARACEDSGVAFVGPSADQIVGFGLKHRARQIAEECGVPLLPGTKLLGDVEQAAIAAQSIGYPVMLKSTAGGGGIGMRVCEDEAGLRDSYEVVARLGKNNFNDGGLFLEKFVRRARHIEVQLFGDGQGKIAALMERDCSAQRRNQKVVEETPAPDLTEEIRMALRNAARKLGEAVKYRSAGTVEFVYDADTGAFYFLEVNTRLQVEHGVTEEIYGIDLVEWMLRLPMGDTSFLDALPEPKGHAVQVRVYAEDPNKNFQPSSGLLTQASFPGTVRVESWVDAGTQVSAYYDPLLAKLIAFAPNREACLDRMAAALNASSVAGIETNIRFLRAVIDHEPFRAGKLTTRMLDSFTFSPNTVDVLEPGAVTTVQDVAGRIGFWHVGVPPSGAMDAASMRLANKLVGNNENAAALEITMAGPALRFNREAVVALTGAEFLATLGEEPFPLHQAVTVPAGAVLKVGRIGAAGVRGYMAVAGGIDVPEYLGSRSTFTLGGFGGHAGRALQVGDVLPLGEVFDHAANTVVSPPTWSNEWAIRVLYGPHGAPDFFTPGDMEMFFSTDWKVHYNSNPTGIRLIGPKPTWARKDGGEAGLHPSNIHDNAYAIGAVDFTGDMPIILGPDGPSLGGFVCPAVIISADLWTMGQLRPGDTVRFVPVTADEAEAAALATEEKLAAFAYPQTFSRPVEPVLPAESPIVSSGTEVCYRQQGDRYLLVEYGPLVLDLDLRFRIHALMLRLEERSLAGIVDLTPGIRSLQIHFDPRSLPRKKLLAELQSLEGEMGSLDELEVPSRIVHLPLSWDDPATRLAIEKYMQSVRPDAPWCPSNIEFIRRINGLDSIEDVKRIVFDASYLVMGLGDVYLGAPVATPLDPRHRLVTTKYNPARTWTPENAVGIGGAYMCIYGMEGPGGYQFVGRTVQVWNTWRQTQDFTQGKPWLLRFFDQIRFYPVSAEELLEMRTSFLRGGFELKTEETTFRLRDYHAFLAANANSIDSFRQTQRQAFQEERERWQAAGSDYSTPSSDFTEVETNAEDEIPDGAEVVRAPLSGNLWKVLVKSGDKVAAGQPVAIIEAMKMETTLGSPCAGVVQNVLAVEGRPVTAGKAIAVIAANG